MNWGREYQSIKKLFLWSSNTFLAKHLHRDSSNSGWSLELEPAVNGWLCVATSDHEIMLHEPGRHCGRRVSIVRPCRYDMFHFLLFLISFFLHVIFIFLFSSLCLCILSFFIFILLYYFFNFYFLLSLFYFYFFSLIPFFLISLFPSIFHFLLIFYCFSSMLFLFNIHDVNLLFCFIFSFITPSYVCFYTYFLLYINICSTSVQFVSCVWLFCYVSIYNLFYKYRYLLSIHICFVNLYN
jgi:hypothetical protein